MSPSDQIGFSQRVRLEWLEQTASLVLAGNDKSALIDTLQGLLRDKVSVGGSAERGNREKIITILMRVWFKTPGEIEPLRTDGLKLLRHLAKTERIAVHWGMAMAVYPVLVRRCEPCGTATEAPGLRSSSPCATAGPRAVW